jgi:hypothetical protein
MGFLNGRIRMSTFRPACVSAIALIALAASGATATATTAPGTAFTVRATMTDGALVLIPTKGATHYQRFIFQDGHVAKFPRGAVIRFVILNKGSKPYLPGMRVTDASNRNPYETQQNLYTASRVVPPGARIDFTFVFTYRGGFSLQTLLHRKPVGKPVKITVI